MNRIEKITVIWQKQSSVESLSGKRACEHCNITITRERSQIKPGRRRSCPSRTWPPTRNRAPSCTAHNRSASCVASFITYSLKFLLYRLQKFIEITETLVIPVISQKTLPQTAELVEEHHSKNCLQSNSSLTCTERRAPWPVPAPSSDHNEDSDPARQWNDPDDEWSRRRWHTEMQGSSLYYSMLLFPYSSWSIKKIK